MWDMGNESFGALLPDSVGMQGSGSGQRAPPAGLQG